MIEKEAERIVRELIAHDIRMGRAAARGAIIGCILGVLILLAVVMLSYYTNRY